MEKLEFSEIKFPDIRVNLIAYVNSLSDMQYQKQFWGKKDPENPEFYDDFDESIHFLYDSTDIASDPESWIGLALKNTTEANLISNLDKSLNELFEKHGTDLKDEEYMQMKEWEFITGNAETLYAELTKEKEENK